MRGYMMGKQRMYGMRQRPENIGFWVGSDNGMYAHLGQYKHGVRGGNVP